MSGMFKKVMTNGENTIGKNSKNFKPTIAIAGVGIASRHCVMHYNENLR